MKSMAFGTFDVIHPGHEFYLREAKKYGELIVVIARDSTVLKVKGKMPMYTENERLAYVEALAGVEKANEGDLGLKIKVSYKPQYIDSSSEELVMVVLRDAIVKYDVELIRPLNIKPLMMKKICELSGGELQRVAIAEALSKEADLVLMDEPSAYLDVEQRLVVSKVIANIIEIRKITCMVVDHDILFLDYLSDRLLVFKGEPAKHGTTEGPLSMVEGMNSLLSHLSITMRRDEESRRPRINKLDSVKDREQKNAGKYYYT